VEGAKLRSAGPSRRFRSIPVKSRRLAAAQGGVRDLYERVLSDPRDARAWRVLALNFAGAGQVSRAVACLDALEATGRGDAPPEEAPALRRAAGREAVARQTGLRASLGGGDACRVSVVVTGRPGEAASQRTLESLAAQSIRRNDRQSIVHEDPSEGLARARGRYVALVEAGDELWPDHLEMLADQLDRTGGAMTYSRALRPGPLRPWATAGHPVVPRQAANEEFVPASCVLVRRRELLVSGGLDPALGHGQAWHLWRRLVERRPVDPVPVLSAQVGSDDVSPERRFDLLLVKRGGLARARRWHRKARRHLDRGDVRLAAADLGHAWNLGLDVEPYLAAVAAVAQHSQRTAASLVALGAGEAEPHLRGAFQRIARGAEARRELAIRMHRHALRMRYDQADQRGLERARSLGWLEGPVG